MASLRAAQKVAFDLTAVRRERVRGKNSGPARDAFIDMTRNMMLPQRMTFSAALTQLITDVAARLDPFIDNRPNQAVIACIEDICPPGVVQRLSDMRVKNLAEAENVQSRFRAEQARQAAAATPSPDLLKNTPNDFSTKVFLNCI